MCRLDWLETIEQNIYCDNSSMETSHRTSYMAAQCSKKSIIRERSENFQFLMLEQNYYGECPPSKRGGIDLLLHGMNIKDFVAIFTFKERIIWRLMSFWLWIDNIMFVFLFNLLTIKILVLLRVNHFSIWHKKREW